MKPVLVLGGGIAGFAAAIRLRELGIPVAVIEASPQPTQKVCGEFLSPECLNTLEKWSIRPALYLSRVEFSAHSGVVAFQLPKAAGSLSRIILEQQLGQCAASMGAELHLGAAAKAIRPRVTGGYEVELTSGQILSGVALIAASGRLSWGLDRPAMPKLPPKYVGLKAHFAGIKLSDCLEMCVLPGAYVGLSAVGEGKTNIALLAHSGLFRHCGSSDALWQALLDSPSAAKLRSRVAGSHRLFPEWLQAEVPEFGLRQQLEQPHVYFAGDAMGSIAPISGEGLAMGIASGCMAAEYCARGSWSAFQRDSQRRFGPRIRWAGWLHKALLKPPLAKSAAILCRICPGLPQLFYKQTRR